MTGITAGSRERVSQAQDNYAAFKNMIFDKEYNGQFALLHNRELIEVYQTRVDAVKTGQLLYKGLGNFSVQKIGETPASLGFLSSCLA